MQAHERRLLLFGFGYSGERFCRRQQAAGWQVQVVVRSEETRERVEALGAMPIELNNAAMAVSQANALLVVAPPTEAGCPALEVLGPALQALTPAVSERDRQGMSWIGYASSTAVYGDQQGHWTTEDSPLNTASPTGMRRLNAENAWMAACRPTSLPLVIFRLAGIYGPGRSALDRIRAGRARRIEKNNHVLSRIHVDDIVSLLDASLQHPNHSIYNVCDDEPASTSDVVTYAAGLLGVEPPAPEPFESAVMSNAAERYFLESRRISNARARSTLGWQPRYPSYREGLKAIFKGEAAQQSA
ncbi:MAG: SDR family oxidoreductase [Proteobacteria bacterium]|nr:SDR family oxidoreductase [Pseudomonadota bacterium]